MKFNHLMEYNRNIFLQIHAKNEEGRLWFHMNQNKWSGP